uniref:Uncharacterized protein n=1 Tax=Knipowitschia caucasica TaxID=637954 RepID=A0AAV2K9V5_KNICA
MRVLHLSATRHLHTHSSRHAPSSITVTSGSPASLLLLRLILFSLPSISIFHTQGDDKGTPVPRPYITFIGGWRGWLRTVVPLPLSQTPSQVGKAPSLVRDVHSAILCRLS